MQASHEENNLLSRGGKVLIGLVVLTGVEFWVAVGGLSGTLVLLGILALAKAVIIAEYYMHAGHIMGENKS
jgi:hypothetical protein|tara:strand:- start:82 stop:294 length:213 start_codon:yes stop_codon:yes gene_type:complete